MSVSVSRVHADVNEKLGEEWYNYNAFSVSWGSLDNYEIVKRVGKGKYSDVFEGLDLIRDERCIIKALKPVKKSKIKREIKILQNLVGGPNIVELLDVVRDPQSKIPSLITEYVDSVEFKSWLPMATDHDIRFYMCELLKALEYCHSKGIIHRDVKPHNIMFNTKERKLRLIDWGLAEFYHPGIELNVRVATRCYKGPELLVDFREYDYSLDIWSTGCVFATLLFNKEPFFYGRDNYDQLVKIVKVLGTSELYRYLDKYELELEAGFDGLLGVFPRRPWSYFITNENRGRIPSEALGLLDALLKVDHQERLTASEALGHKYFSALKPTLEHANPSDDSGLD